jgi:hypothetical protein
MGSSATPATQTQQTDQKYNQQSSSTTGPSEYLSPYLKQAVEGISKYFDSGTPSLYSGSYTAAPSDYTNQATAAYANYSNPSAGANTALTNATLQGDYLNLDKNPYFQSALTASLAPATENFAKNIVPTLRSTFAGAGRPGAGLEGSALQDATTSFNRSVADASAKVGAQAYGDERNRQLQTQGMLSQFQNMDIQRLGLLEKAGQTQDTYNQKLRDEEVQRYNYAQTGGLDFLTGLAQRLQAAYPGGTTSGTSSGTSSGTTTGTGQGASNSGAATLSTIMGGVGTAASIASMFV